MEGACFPHLPDEAGRKSTKRFITRSKHLMLPLAFQMFRYGPILPKHSRSERTQGLNWPRDEMRAAASSSTPLSRVVAVGNKSKGIDLTR